MKVLYEGVTYNLDENALNIAKKYTFHKQTCSLGVGFNEEGDFCTCNIRERRINLALEITKLLEDKKDLSSEDYNYPDEIDVFTGNNKRRKRQRNKYIGFYL